MKIFKYLRYLLFGLRRIRVDLFESYGLFSVIHANRPANLKLGKGVKINSSEGLSIGDNVRIGNGSQLLLVPISPAAQGKRMISLGNNVKVGSNTELIAWDFNHLQIKDYTTIQDNCKILGEICIEKYNTFAPNVFVSSGNHYTDAFPGWLMKDQDKEVLSTESGVKAHIRGVHFEEDCWIGYGAFIARGVYIGRGAVIGANSVVNRDVHPYSIVGGIPAREIKKRLDFKPRSMLKADQDLHLPYFYRGFGQRREELKGAREINLIYSSGRSMVVMLKGKFEKLRIEGELFTNTGTMHLYLNGQQISSQKMEKGPFKLHTPIVDQLRASGGGKRLSETLKDCHIFELEIESPNEKLEWPWGIRTIEMTNGKH